MYTLFIILISLSSYNIYGQSVDLLKGIKTTGELEEAIIASGCLLKTEEAILDTGERFRLYYFQCRAGKVVRESWALYEVNSEGTMARLRKLRHKGMVCTDKCRNIPSSRNKKGTTIFDQLRKLVYLIVTTKV